jgi:hypothetical protein
MTIPPPPPIDMTPRMFVRQIRPHRWETWGEAGMGRFAAEWGTYAWSQKGAERKARRLLRLWEKRHPKTAPIEVQP